MSDSMLRPRLALTMGDVAGIGPEVVDKALSQVHVPARLFGRGWDRVDRRGLAFMQAAGVQFTKADAGFVKAVKDKTASLEDTWAKAAEAKGLKDAHKVLAEFRAEIAKLEK